MLAALVPVRYAKDELSSGYLGSIERYAYIAPVAPPSASAEPPASEPPQSTKLEGDPHEVEVALAGAK